MKLKPFTACLLAILMINATAAAQVDESTRRAAAERLHALFAERHQWRLDNFPEDARMRGDYRHAERITDDSLAAIERRHGETRAHLGRLVEIERGALSAADQLNYDLFDLDLRMEIEGHRFRMFLAPVGPRSGPHQRIPQMHVRSRFSAEEDYVNYLRRLEATPKSITDTIALLRLGVEEGRTPPKVTMAGLPNQFRGLLDGDGLEALAEPFANFPAAVPAESQATLRERFEGVTLPAVRSALAEFATYVTEEYIPSCRESIAATALPDGDAYYAYRLRDFTTTELTAEQIHETGLREVARLRAEMLGVIRASDFMQRFAAGDGASNGAADVPPADELFRQFLQYLRSDSRFYHKSPAELLSGYRDICKRVDAELPRLFRRLPRLPYGVREIPLFMAPNQTTAWYSHGDIRSGEPGYFYANTYALDQRPKYEMIALAMHEAVPGHHLQIALAQEQEDLPEFRKDVWFTAFGEGWALYSERLGLEMRDPDAPPSPNGLYADPYDNFGRLLYEMWRACRLVVDPGMHALGWSREQAVQFMLDNTALSELNINAEIDRYIAWPGQATAYKIGELKITELRRYAETTLGERFDIRAFHDVVLSAGCIPLNVLEARVQAWVEGRP